MSFLQKNFFHLLLMAFLSSIFYGIAIYLYPGFHTDDYLNFGLVSLNYRNFFSLNILSISSYELSHFVIRPISYLSLFYNHILFDTNSVLMKSAIIPIHIIFVCLFYCFLNLSSEFFQIKFNVYLALFISILLSFHPNNFWWVYWVSNQNELLMMLFYLLALIFILKYLNGSVKKYLWLYLIAFLLSIFSKQQAIHLPILIIFFCLIFKDKISAERFNAVLRVSLIGVFFTVVLSIVSFLFFSVDSFQFEYA